MVIFLTKNRNNKKTAEELMITAIINNLCLLFIAEYSREKMAQRTYSIQWRNDSPLCYFFVLGLCI